MMYKEKKIEEITNCPECSSSYIIRDYIKAETICHQCGLVIEDELIDHGPEWRIFEDNKREKLIHIGAPTTYLTHDKGLSTEIGWSNRDAYGKLIPMKNRSQVRRLRTWHRRIRYSSPLEKNLAVGLTNLSRLTSRIGLPRLLRETAASIYRKAVYQQLQRGRKMETLTAAALYAGCRQSNAPRTLNEISQISDVPRKEIGRTYRVLSRELNLKLLPTFPEDYLPRFFNKLKLNHDVQIKTREILKKAANKKLIDGRGPIGIAAASIYIASILCNQPRTQQEIADVAGVTEVTIRNRYKELVEKLRIRLS